LEQRIAELRAEIGGLGARIDTGLASLRAELIKRMFIFWTGTTVTTIGLTLALLRR
jgi:hypothetical protein